MRRVLKELAHPVPVQDVDVCMRGGVGEAGWQGSWMAARVRRTWVWPGRRGGVDVTGWQLGGRLARMVQGKLRLGVYVRCAWVQEGSGGREGGLVLREGWGGGGGGLAFSKNLIRLACA